MDFPVTARKPCSVGLAMELDKARGRIYLPRRDLEYTWETTRKEAPGLVTRTVGGTRRPDAPLHAGSWCRYCRALAVCPEVR